MESKYRPHIGKNVSIGEGSWIGVNAMILPGVDIPKHCIIAAGSIVTKSLEQEGGLYAGIPAKLVRKL